MEGRDSPVPGQRLGLLRPQSTSWKAKITLPSPFLACAQSSARPAPHHRHSRSEGQTLQPKMSGYVQFPPDPLKISSVSVLPCPSDPSSQLFLPKTRKSFPIRKRFSHRRVKSSPQFLFSHCAPVDLRLFSQENSETSGSNRLKFEDFAVTIMEEEEDWTEEEKF